MTRIDHTGHDHLATPAGRAACRKTEADRRAVLQARWQRLMDDCHRSGDQWMGRDNARQYLTRAYLRLNLGPLANPAPEMAARALVQYDYNHDGTNVGMTWSNIMRMYS